MELLKLLNLGEIIAQLLSFFVLLVLLRIFAWKRILNILQQRRQRISSEFDKIKEAKEEVAVLKHDYEVHLARIEQKSRERVNEAIEEGRKITEQMRKDAFAQSEDIISDARKNVAYELKKAQEEIKSKIVDLAIDAAETVIRDKFTGADDRRVVEEFIDNIDKTE